MQACLLSIVQYNYSKKKKKGKQQEEPKSQVACLFLAEMKMFVPKFRKISSLFSACFT